MFGAEKGVKRVHRDSLLEQEPRFVKKKIDDYTSSHPCFKSQIFV